MPSYTSSSNAKSRYKFNIVAFFLTILALFLLSNYIIHHHFFGRTTATWYINNMPSKERHMALNLKGKPSKDAIFIGNSRTLFQIGTDLMATYQINIYNLGVSGHDLPDFPSMVESALPFHPKLIVLNVSPSGFYARLTVPRDVDWADIKAYTRAGLNKRYILSSVLQYFRHWFLIDTYSTNINLRIRSAYQAFGKLYNHFSLSNVKNSFKNSMFLKKANPFDPALVRCHLFRIAHPKYIAAVGMCTNGDGVLAGNAEKDSSDHDAHIVKHVDAKLNQQQILLMNYLINIMKKAGVQPVLVFTPLYQGGYPEQSIKQVEAALDAPVIDMTNLKLSNALWADKGHLNFHGRAVYTKKVAMALRSRFRF